MSGKKKLSKKDKATEVNEPVLDYGKRTIHVFKSLQEQEEFELMKMAKQTPEESLNKLEALRRFFFREFLLPDGTWKPLERVITMREPFKE